VIPCALTIKTNDSQALDLLATPAAIVVVLQRKVEVLIASLGQQAEAQTVQETVWWPSGDATTNDCERRLQGEIHLPEDLLPSSDMPAFLVKVLSCPQSFFRRALT
jgi:hypothetical protein